MPGHDYNQVFQTAEVAAAVGVPEWRIIKFVEGKEYRIQPSVSRAKGTGTRRLYSVFDIYEIAIANQLLGDGFRPAVIGHVIDRGLRSPLEATLAWDGKTKNWFKEWYMKKLVKERKDRVLMLSFERDEMVEGQVSLTVAVKSPRQLARIGKGETNCYFLWLDRLLNQIDERIWGKKRRRKS